MLMIADFTSAEVPGYNVNQMALHTFDRSSLPLNLILPPNNSDGTPRDILETPTVLLPGTVIDFLDKASSGNE